MNKPFKTSQSHLTSKSYRETVPLTHHVQFPDFVNSLNKVQTKAAFGPFTTKLTLMVSRNVTFRENVLCQTCVRLRLVQRVLWSEARKGKEPST